LEILGMSADGFQAQGTLMALSELHLRYKGPLRAGDKFYATVAVSQVRANRSEAEERVNDLSDLMHWGGLMAHYSMGPLVIWVARIY
jgi:acyl-CoA thioesterase FadM